MTIETPLTEEMLAAADRSPNRMWALARMAVELGWDVRVTPQDITKFSLRISDETHSLYWKWRLHEFRGEAKWSRPQSASLPGCNECDRVRYADLEAFLADPPVGHSRWVPQGAVLVGAVTL